MSLYMVKPGSILQLDSGFYQASDIVELVGAEEAAVLATQGHKIEPADPPSPPAAPPTALRMVGPAGEFYVLGVDEDGALIVTAS